MLLVAGAGLLWGTGGLSGALLISRSGIDSFAVAGCRLAVGGGLVVVWLLVTGQLCNLPLGRHSLRRLGVLGLLAAWYQSCYFVAVELTSVGVATLITLGAAPVLVVAAESFVGRRLPARRTAAAVAIALIGLVLLVDGPGVDGAGTAPAGALAALASAGGFAAITMLGARRVDGVGALPTIGLAFVLGGLVILPAAAAAGRVAVELDVETVTLLLYLGLVPTALAYVLYFRGLRSVVPGSAALISLLEPLAAASLAALFLHERLGASQMLGALLIGVAITAVATGPGMFTPRVRPRARPGRGTR
ncbi:EamA family transporter [Phytoactinopolyspora alkaliphila]|uniref:EamA family transporter n=1 Tax=Phytoactinopolyspora alkaliphila TaxID=1783498 RepID=A0A6N9YU83_9ACTN|nr:EamA family transporter [Phytoactinopolyspora alkaliphila]